MAVTLEQFRTATKDLDGSTELWVDDEGAVLAAWKMHNEQLNGEFVVLSTYRDPSSPQKQEVFTLLVEDPLSVEEIASYAEALGGRAATVDARTGPDSREANELAEEFQRLRERNPALADPAFHKGYRSYFVRYADGVRRATAGLSNDHPF